MFDARRLLDALVSAASQVGAQASQPGGIGRMVDQVVGQLGPGAQQATQSAGAVLGQATQGVREVAQQANASTGNLGAQVDQTVSQLTGGQSTADLLQKAKDFSAQNPGVAEAALITAAGLLLGTRQGRGITGSAAGLGGLALIGGLAYKAFQNFQAGQPLIATGGEAPAKPAIAPPAPAAPALTAALPAPAAFDPKNASDDDAVRYLRAMVAAATSDGFLDAGERARITSGLAQAGIDEQATRWLERELGSPATVDELSEGVNTPEKAAQVYAAARIAIEPNTMQEREFLRQLAEALDVEAALVRQIDDAATGLRSPS